MGKWNRILDKSDPMHDLNNQNRVSLKSKIIKKLKNKK